MAFQNVFDIFMKCLFVVLLSCQQSMAAKATSLKFLCNQHYDNADATILSTRNDSIRLTVLKSEPVDFNTAQTICRKCWDGSLVQQDDVTKLLKYLPLWIGVTSKPGFQAHAGDWVWLDGTKVNQWQQNYATDIIYPKIFKEGAYSMYAIPNNWNKQPHGYRYDDDYNNNNEEPIIQIPSILGMKWVALTADNSFEHQLEPYVLNEEERSRISHMKYIVCERPYRKTCHFWNHTEENCSMDAKFGCHNYLNAMYHRSDDNNVTCAPPDVRRYAIECDCMHCTCQVSGWSAWSSCGEEICSVHPQTRTRQRKQLDATCPGVYIHPKLLEEEQCQIPGCDLLLKKKLTCAFN